MQNSLRTYRLQNDMTLSDLGRLVGVRRAAVCKWERKRVPAERVLDVERVTGIPRHELRPDLYPPGAP